MEKGKEKGKKKNIFYGMQDSAHPHEVKLSLTDQYKSEWDYPFIMYERI